MNDSVRSSHRRASCDERAFSSCRLATCGGQDSWEWKPIRSGRVSKGHARSSQAQEYPNAIIEVLLGLEGCVGQTQAPAVEENHRTAENSFDDAKGERADSFPTAPVTTSQEATPDRTELWDHGSLRESPLVHFLSHY